MRNINDTMNALEKGGFDTAFRALYPLNEATAKKRYAAVLESFAGLFGREREVRLFSAPGRTEIGGNHTDHQRGRVIAAAIDLDTICVASKNSDNTIRICSAGHRPVSVNLSDLSPKENEKDSSVSIVRGIAARFLELGYNVEGFDACTSSNVPRGSGLSSSAAFETAVGVMISHFFNDGRISASEIARVGQYAENSYYGKPCGLMDQMASSVGGLLTMDFADAANPVITPVNFDFSSCGHSICIINTGSDHADLTGEYAAIPSEMRAVAEYLGAEVLGEADEAAFYAAIPAIREKFGDRAVLRAVHFFSETKRPGLLARCLEAGDFDGFKQIIIESGDSSFCCLQNAFAPGSPEKQGIPLALALSKSILRGAGAWRVHGGGFAGTIQAFVPDSMLDTYCSHMECVFGTGSCHILHLRDVGGTALNT